MTEERAGLPILAFPDVGHLDAFLERQPADAKGIWIKFAKQGSGVASVAKTDAIDAALCHGWIDGQLDRYDDRHWLVRFTPRRRGSRWSAVNVTRVGELIAAGRMRPAGLAQVAAARADGRWDAAYAPASTIAVPDDLALALAASPQAEAFFATLTGANRYAILYRIGAVKRPETRARKIAEFVAMLERGDTLHG